MGDRSLEVTTGSIQLKPQGSLNGAPAKVTDEIEESLLNVSENVERPVEVHSGVRTPAQNRAVGGAPRSQHLTTNGGAADISIPGMSGSETAQEAFNSGEFSRVNDYQDGRVHVDNRPTNTSGLYRQWRPVLMPLPRARPTPPPRPQPQP